MKKLLALVLALVMTLGLATVGTNAANWSDLKDTDKVAADREEAFKVLNSIQIFEGDENNNLNPDAQLTRAEAAKIIATLNLGKTAADNLSGNGGKFSDVPASNWASGYIEYCASTGIIAGRGDGTFDPAGSLTFAAFSKMLLVSLGYVAEVEELVGGEWEFNVARIATTIDLYKGMDTPASKEIVKRADAAQMAFNVLKTPMVTYAYNGTNLLTNISAVGKTAAVYETTAARDTQTISTATVNDGSARGTYMVEFAERHFPKLVRNSHDVDEWGRPATTWTNNREVVGSFVNNDIMVYTTTENVKGSELYKVLGGATLLSRYANDLTRSGAWVDIYVDGVELTEKTNPTYTQVYNRIKDQGSWMSDLNAANGIRVAGAGTELTVYLDEDSYYNYGVVTNDTAKIPVVTIVVRNTWLAEAYADYNTTDKNLLLGVYTADDAPETYKAATSKVDADLTGYKEGDWVLVKMTRDDSTIREVTDPEIVKGAYINAYTVKDGMSTITVDSKDEYGVAATAHTDATILNKYQLRELQGFTYDLYTDGNADHLYGIQYASKDTDLVFVVGYEKDSTVLAASTIKTNLIFMDGTMATKTVSLSQQGSAREYFTAAGRPAKNQVLNAWFTYAKDANGNITLRDIVPFAKNSTAGGQFSVVMDNTYDQNPDIDSKHTTLAYTDKNNQKLFAIGSDNSVYISVVATDTVVNDDTNEVGAIARVAGVTKGIKNTSLLGTNTAKFTNLSGKTVNLDAFNKTTTVGGAAKSNAYFVYDDNRYVVAAVVLTENTTADHLMYVVEDGVNGVTKREYITGIGYVDHYTAIIDGKTELVDVKVDSLKTNTDGKKLIEDTLYAIAYDSTGEYVTYAIPASNLPVELTTTLNQQRGFAMYEGAVKAGNKIQLGDEANKRTTNMLYVKDDLGNNVGYIATNTSGNFWVYRPETETYTRYNTASAAVAASTTADSKGNTYAIDSVYAICDKSTGYGSTMVFIAKQTNAAGTVVVAGKSSVVGDIKVVGTTIPVNYYGAMDAQGEAQVVGQVETWLKNNGYTVAKVQRSTGSVAPDAKFDFTVTDKNGTSRVLTTAPAQVYKYTLNGTLVGYVEAGKAVTNWTAPTTGTYYEEVQGTGDTAVTTYRLNNVQPNTTGYMPAKDMEITTGYVGIALASAPTVMLGYVSVAGGTAETTATADKSFSYTSGTKKGFANTDADSNITLPAVTANVFLTEVTQGLYVNGELIEALADGVATTTKWEDVLDGTGTGYMWANDTTVKALSAAAYVSAAGKTGAISADPDNKNIQIWTGYVQVTGADSYEVDAKGNETKVTGAAKADASAILEVGAAGTYRVDGDTSKEKSGVISVPNTKRLTYNVGSEDITVKAVNKLTVTAGTVKGVAFDVKTDISDMYLADGDKVTLTFTATLAAGGTGVAGDVTITPDVGTAAASTITKAGALAFLTANNNAKVTVAAVTNAGTSADVTEFTIELTAGATATTITFA